MVGHDAVGHVDAIHIILADLASVRPHASLALRAAISAHATWESEGESYSTWMAAKMGVKMSVS